LELARYLNTTKHDITAKTEGRRTNIKVMLLWEIDIDWTGSAMSNISITASGISSDAKKHLSDVFASLIPSKGVIAAFESIWGLLHSDEVRSGGVTDANKGKRKRKSL
jgi:hypothetical protein